MPTMRWSTAEGQCILTIRRMPRQSPPFACCRYDHLYVDYFPIPFARFRDRGCRRIRSMADIQLKTVRTCALPRLRQMRYSLVIGRLLTAPGTPPQNRNATATRRTTSFTVVRRPRERLTPSTCSARTCFIFSRRSHLTCNSF